MVDVATGQPLERRYKFERQRGIRNRDGPGSAPFLRIAKCQVSPGMPEFAVFRGDSSLLFKIPTGRSSRAVGGTFSRDGNSLAVGWKNGMVVVADLAEIDRQLERFGIAPNRSQSLSQGGS